MNEMITHDTIETNIKKVHTWKKIKITRVRKYYSQFFIFFLFCRMEGTEWMNMWEAYEHIRMNFIHDFFIFSLFSSSAVAFWYSTFVCLSQLLLLTVYKSAHTCMYVCMCYNFFSSFLRLTLILFLWMNWNYEQVLKNARVSLTVFFCVHYYYFFSFFLIFMKGFKRFPIDMKRNSQTRESEARFAKPQL